MSGPSDSQPDWEAHRHTIEDLYWSHGKELPEVMKTMESAHGFVATYVHHPLRCLLVFTQPGGPHP